MKITLEQSLPLFEVNNRVYICVETKNNSTEFSIFTNEASHILSQEVLSGRVVFIQAVNDSIRVVVRLEDEKGELI